MKAWICVFVGFGLLLISGSVFPEGDADNWKTLSDEEASAADEAENIRQRDSDLAFCVDRGDFCEYRFEEGGEYFNFVWAEMECFTVGDCAVAQSRCGEVVEARFEKREAERRSRYAGESGD